jgi:hypothetical protein
MDSIVSNNGPISAETSTIADLPKIKEVSEIYNLKADEIASGIAAVVVEYLFKANVAEKADNLDSTVAPVAVEAFAPVVEKEVIETPDKIASAVASAAVEAFSTTMVKMEATETSDKTASAVADAVLETLTAVTNAEENFDNLNVSPPPAKKSKTVPHPCELCGLVCSSKYNFIRHQRQKHPNGECGVDEAVGEAVEEAPVVVYTAEDSPKLISHAHLYDYGNGMYAMFTNMIQTNPKM